jgi:RHS repeat-associated protein
VKNIKFIVITISFFASVLFGNSLYQDNISKAVIKQDKFVNQLLSKSSTSDTPNSDVFYAIHPHIPTADLGSSRNEIWIGVYDINTKQMIDHYALSTLLKAGVSAVHSNPPSYNYDLYGFYRGTAYNGLSERDFDASLTTCELKEKTMARIQSSGQYWYPTNDYEGDLTYEGGKDNYWIVISANQYLFNLIDNLFPENNCTGEPELKDGEEGECKVPTGSFVIPKYRSFHEDIAIQGSDISLHYSSERTAGYKNPLHPYLISDIASGWTLSNLHHYHNKTLFLGNGEVIEYKDYEITIDAKTKNIIVYDKSHIGHEFDKDGKILRSFNPKSAANIYTYSYDKKTNLLVSMTDMFGGVTKLNRDNSGKVLSVTAPFGQVTYLNINNDDLISVSYEDNSIYSFTYDNKHLLTSKTDPKGYVYNYSYDNNGRISKTSNPLNQEYLFDSYIQNSTSFASFTTPSGSFYSYSNAKTNSEGAQYSASKTPFASDKTVNTFNDKKDIEKTYCGIKEKISYDIDALSMQKRVAFSSLTTPSGLTNEADIYTNYNKLLSKGVYKDTTEFTSNGKTTTVVTDYLLGSQTITSPENRKKTIRFEPSTNLPLGITQTGKPSVHFSYNSKKQLIRYADGVESYSYSYDSKGRLSSITDALLNRYSYSYDNKDRITSIKTPNNNIIYFFYDPNGNMIRLTNPNYHDNSFDYDALNQRNEWITPFGYKTHYEYNGDNKISKITKASGKSISYEYENSSLKRVITPDERYNYKYDCLGQVSLIYLGDDDTNSDDDGDNGDNTNSGGGNNNGDSNGGENNTCYPFAVSTTHQLYPPNTNPCLNNNGTAIGFGKKIFYPGVETAKKSMTRYSYDGYLLTNIRHEGTLNQDISFTYNSDFLPSSITYSNEKENLSYDKDNLLIKSNDLLITRDRYNGNILKQQENTYEKELSYLSLYHEPYELKDKIEGKRTYGYVNNIKNSAGKLLTQTEYLHDRTLHHTYTYDKEGRLTRASTLHSGIKNERPSSYYYIEEFSYDPQGNILKHTITDKNQKSIKQGIYDIDDRTELFDNTNYIYDLDGQLISKINGEGITAYKYDTFGNLKEAILPNGTKITYLYNVNNQRSAKLINGRVVEKYLWLNLTTLLAIYDKYDNLITRFYYLDDRVPYKVKHNNQIYYLSYNHIGSLKQITNTKGQTVKSIIYSAYGNIIDEIYYDNNGNVIKQNDSFGNIINDSNPNLNIPIGFAGGLYDKDTKLTKFGYRDYDSYTGRWITKDPIDFEGGDSNLYGYVLNDPVNLIDPEGLNPPSPLNPKHPAFCVLVSGYETLEKGSKQCEVIIDNVSNDPWKLSEICKSPWIGACKLGCTTTEFWEDLKENCTPNPTDMRQKLPKPIPKEK